MNRIDSPANGPQMVYERSKNGHVFLKSGAEKSSGSGFSQKLAKALGFPIDPAAGGKRPSGQALAQWARNVMIQADRRLLSLVQNEGQTLAPFRPPPFPVDFQLPQTTRQVPVDTSNFRQKEMGFLPIMREAAEKYNLPISLIRSVIRAESSFNPKAVSHAGAQGLMQLMPGTAKFLGVTDSFDPRQNVHGGAKYLRMMLNRYNNNLSKALAAYNWGPHRVDKGLAKMPEETRNYLKIILRDLGMGQAQKNNRPA